MKKTLTILLALLLLGVQQGVASEKRAEKIKPTRQTKLQKMAEKGDGIGVNVNVNGRWLPFDKVVNY